MNDEAVRRAMRELSEAPERPLPDARKIWWLAEIRRRQEKRQRVTRIMTLTRVSTSVVAVLGASWLALLQEIDFPSLTFLAVSAVVCAVAAGAHAMLANE
jgi:biotin transporter BioY